MLVKIPDRSEFESEGYFDVDAEARTMRWGAETDRDYSGRLTVAAAGGGQREGAGQRSIGARAAEGGIQAGAAEDRNPLEESLGATLESIRRQIEEGSGKLPPPSPEGSREALKCCAGGAVGGLPHIGRA